MASFPYLLRFFCPRILLLRVTVDGGNVLQIDVIQQKEKDSMKKMTGMFVLCMAGFAMFVAGAEVPALDAELSAAAAAVKAAAATMPPAHELTLKGRVGVLSGKEGAQMAIYLFPLEPGKQPSKVDLVNGIGKTLADQKGKVVEAIGVEANRLFTIKTVSVVE
jgi:hypothetical protein